MAGLLGDVLPWVYSQGDRAKRNLNGLLQDPLGSFAQTAGQVTDNRNQLAGLLDQAFANKQRPFLPTDKQALGQAAENMLAGPLGFAPVGMTAPAGAMPYWHNPNKPPKLDQQGEVRDASGAGSAQWAGTDTPQAKAESLARDMRRMLTEDWHGKDFDPSSVRQGLTTWAQDGGLNVGLVYRSFLRELNATKDLPDAAKKRINEAWLQQ